jgi:hypothetical protein
MRVTYFKGCGVSAKGDSHCRETGVGGSLQGVDC